MPKLMFLGQSVPLWTKSSSIFISIYCKMSYPFSGLLLINKEGRKERISDSIYFEARRKVISDSMIDLMIKFIKAVKRLLN